MMNSPTSSHIYDVKGLFHTGIFLRPRIATSLQGLIRNKTIQDRAKFTVAKSQIHPNGLCEIVVKRQDPTVSTNAIMVRIALWICPTTCLNLSHSVGLWLIFRSFLNAVVNLLRSTFYQKKRDIILI